MTSLKKFLSLFIMIIVSFSLTACDFSFNGNTGDIVSNTTKLVAPTSIRVENNVVHWNAVENAGSYIVQVGTEDHQATTSSLEYPISSLYSKSFNGLYVKVKALPSSSLLFSESDWSIPFGPIDYVKPIEEGAPVEVEWDSSIKKSGIGETINAIDSETCYISHYSGSLAYKIFQENALYNIPLLEYSVKTGNLKVSEGSTMQEYYNDFYSDYKMKFSSTSSANAEFLGVFSANASTNFGVSANNSTSINRTTKTTEYYYTYSQIYNGKQLEIQGYRDINTFRNILNDDFLNDAKEVTNIATAQQFFYKYGTHLITGGVWGGRLDASYYIVTDSAEVNSEKVRQIGSSIGTKIGASMDLGDASVGAGSETSLEDEKNLKLIENYKTEAQSSNLSIKTVGGDAVSLSLSNVQNGVQEWAKTLTDNKYEFIDALDGSLIALWDLLPVLDEYSVARNILEEYFKDKCNEDYTNLLQKFNRQNITQEPDGSEEYPFLIYTVEDLEDIKNKGMDKHYILAADIDLSGKTNWIPIGLSADGAGGNYTKFTGSLNGEYNGVIHKIKNLKRTKPTPVFGTDSNAGLFAMLWDGAIVKNICFENLNITYNDTAEVNGSYYKRVGAVAGHASDATIENIIVNGSISINIDGDKHDGWYEVGGIVGRTIGNTNIRYCGNYADITCYQNNVYVGGIAGRPYSDKTNIEHCYNVGDIKGVGRTGFLWANTDASVGGIVGRVGLNGDYTTMISDCYNASLSIIANGARTCHAGAIVGYAGDKTKTSIVHNVYLLTTMPVCGNGNGYIGYSVSCSEEQLQNKEYLNGINSLLEFISMDNLKTNAMRCWVYKTGFYPKLFFESKISIET